MFFLTLLLAALIAAVPLEMKQLALSSPDIDTMHLALYLENLEHELFTRGCSDFSDADYVGAGFPQGFRGEVCVIAQQEAFHITAISELLQANGVAPIPPCTYQFPYTDQVSFVSTANQVSTVGIGAYMGAVKAITDSGDLRESVASILTVEARHDAFLRMGIALHPFPTTFDTGLSAAWAYNLAQPFIVSCPIPLNGIKLPGLKLEGPLTGPVAPGTPITFSWNPDEFLINVDPNAPLYMAGVAENVTDPIYGKVTKINATSGTIATRADIPSGVVYVCLTTFEGGLTMQQLTDYGALAGPLEIMVS